jgi:large subunit ribosomal protein L31
MKKEIHPTMQKIDVKCNSCGASFSYLSTSETYSVEVCSNCHPFYTGDQRIMDTAGRADKFKKRMAKAAALQSSDSKKEAPKAEESPKESAEEVVEETSSEENTEA